MGVLASQVGPVGREVGPNPISSTWGEPVSLPTFIKENYLRGKCPVTRDVEMLRKSTCYTKIWRWHPHLEAERFAYYQSFKIV
jgi:hypothetical protein